MLSYISFSVYVAQILSRIFVEVVFETLNGCPDVTSVKVFRLKLSPHVWQFIIRLLVVEEKIEESLPKLHFGAGITHPIQ